MATTSRARETRRLSPSTTLRAILVPLLALSSFATPPGSHEDQADPASIRGVWYFAEVRITNLLLPPSPPTFDIMEFRDGDDVRLTDTLHKQTFDGKFHLAEDNLTLKFQTPNKVEPVELTMKIGLLYNRRGLLVTIAKEERVFYRRDVFVDEDIAGNWLGSNGVEKVTMVLGKDGSYRLTEGGVSGFYRLWKSGAGPMMTTVVWIQGEGAFTFKNLY